MLSSHCCLFPHKVDTLLRLPKVRREYGCCWLRVMIALSRTGLAALDAAPAHGYGGLRKRCRVHAPSARCRFEAQRARISREGMWGGACAMGFAYVGPERRSASGNRERAHRRCSSGSIALEDGPLPLYTGGPPGGLGERRSQAVVIDQISWGVVL